jgi:hypothetical protein
VHPLAQWGSIAPDFDGSGRSSDVDPEEGSVPAPTLAAILEHCPADGDVIYAVWDGWGSWTDEYDKPFLSLSWPWRRPGSAGQMRATRPSVGSR